MNDEVKKSEKLEMKVSLEPITPLLYFIHKDVNIAFPYRI